jgi:transcriptional regulator with XRE-family HTH domain
MTESIEDLEFLLGQSVRTLRRREDLTQVELAERANVALGALKALERGRNTTTETLLKILRVLHRTDWVRQLAPSVPIFSPLALLEQRSRAPRSRTGHRDQAKASV